MTINQPHNDTIPKSSSTDESHHSQFSQNDKHLSLTTTTTTSSSGILNDQQSLLKQPSRKHVRISNPHPSQISYRDTLLQALNPTTNNLHQMSPIKKLSNLIHSGENNCWSSKEAIPNDNKCFNADTKNAQWTNRLIFFKLKMTDYF